MDQLADNSNQIGKILLARNTPVALVVGAASFFGSHLVDKLLQKNLQVIGIDDLKDGDRKNLTQASEDKNFHLIIDSVDSLEIDLKRLDYIFIIPEKGQKLEKIIAIFRKFKSRLLLVSSISLYDEAEEDLVWLRRIESQIAKEAKEENLNARILRLGPLYGPRMSFDFDDPLIKLVQQSLTGDLQKDTTLEFSSRSLYVEDAVSLAIKCIMAGATAQKIFDGVLPAPIKVTEIKQILLDPVWYENKQFIPTELPPWPTPNLDKTQKFLNWHPHTHLVSFLKQTLAYFKDNEIKVPKVEVGNLKMLASRSREDRKEWQKEKAEQLAGLKNKEEPKKAHKNKGQKWIGRGVYLLAAAFISYALIWPIFQLGWGVATFRFQLSAAINSLEKGRFEDSLFAVRQASDGITQAKSIFYSMEPIRKLGIFKDQFEKGDNLIKLATLSAESAQNTILGIQALYKSLKSITGEANESPRVSFEQASVYLAAADEQISRSEAQLKNGDFKKGLPQLIQDRVDSLSERISVYSNLIKRSRALSTLLPEVVANKKYLILLQNNGELRPTGGLLGSFVLVSFEEGKLKSLQAHDTYEADGQLKIHVEPPKEIKDDLGQKDYFLRDSNWEPDFPTSARQAEWFYNKEMGERVSGVIALDISAIEDLLKVVGPLDLSDYNEKIDASNLFAKSISHAEVNFFPGSQAKKSFLTSLVASLFNKLFFLPNQNWPSIVTSLGHSLESKHMSIYLDDPTFFSYLVSQKWAAILPRGSKEDQGDFLAPVEANLGGNYANYYLDRSYSLETVIGKDGEVSHRLRIAYTNRSPQEAFPAGKYKNRMRIYLPFGTRLNRVLWGEKDMTKDVSSFIDYGRTGYSFLIELSPKEQKTLVLDYQPPLKLAFKDNKALYKLDVIKQAGTLKDAFEWRVNYPINMKLSSNQSQKLGYQEYTIKTDLSQDKSFQLEFVR